MIASALQSCYPLLYIVKYNIAAGNVAQKDILLLVVLVL